MAVYLLHIEPAYHHARHYLGYADDHRLKEHIEAHKAGKGSKLTQAVVAAGHTLTVVRVWMGKDRTYERQLKNLKNVPRTRCPVCRGEQPLDYEVQALVPGFTSWEEWAEIWDEHLAMGRQ